MAEEGTHTISGERAQKGVAEDVPTGRAEEGAWWGKSNESPLSWNFSVHSSRRCAQINVGLLESSQASEGFVMALLQGRIRLLSF